MVYDNIVSICKHRNLPIYLLEKKAHIGNGTISGWKDGSPRLDKLQAIADALEVPITELLK